MKNKGILFAVIILIGSVLYNFALNGGDSREEELRVELVYVDSGTGPESLLFDSNGEGPYVGLSDGRILKWQGREQGWLEFATVSSPQLLSRCRGSKNPNTEHLCGRPLGLAFSKTGDLYIADAYRGLMVVRVGEKFAIPLTQGLQLGFTNSVEIDEKGVVYFTDSSRNFQRRQYHAAILSGDNTGRLMKYDPNTKQVQVLLDNLHFPNGILLTEDSSAILLVETTTCRILRYHFHDSQVQVVAQLPGFPDNIKRSSRGGFWVAMRPKSLSMQLILSSPTASKAIQPLGPQLYKLTTFLNKSGGRALAMRLSEQGEMLELLDGFGGRKLRYVSEVVERNNSLWVGSVFMPYVGIYKL